MHWDDFLTSQDKAVFAAAGFGQRAGLGQRPALLVIDVTLGFCGDKEEPIFESIKKWRTSCGEVAWEAIPRIKSLSETARDRGVPVIYTRGSSLPVNSLTSGLWAEKNSRKLADPPEANEIVPPLRGLADLVIEKDKPSAFFGTPLLSYLISLEVDSLLICGTTTSGCVRATVVDAFSYNYRVGLISEATFDRSEVSHWVGLFDMHMKYADVITEQDARAYLLAGSFGPLVTRSAIGG